MEYNIQYFCITRIKIVTLDGMQTEIKSGSQIRKVGKSYRTFYMIEFAGINPETGAPSSIQTMWTKWKLH